MSHQNFSGTKIAAVAFAAPCFAGYERKTANQTRLAPLHNMLVLTMAFPWVVGFSVCWWLFLFASKKACQQQRMLSLIC